VRRAGFQVQTNVLAASDRADLWSVSSAVQHIVDETQPTLLAARSSPFADRPRRMRSSFTALAGGMVLAVVLVYPEGTAMTRETGMSFTPGMRCRSARTIVIRRGNRSVAPRSGLLVSQRENLGRTLFTVDFDTGQRLILFAHEIEPIAA